MTTPAPMDNVPMPYSVVFVPTVGEYNAIIPVEMRNLPAQAGNSIRLGLYPGVSIVQVAWSGQERLRFHHWPGTAFQIIDIPAAAAGTQRTATVTVSHETTTAISCTIGTPTETSESILSARRIAVTVMPFSTPTNYL